MLWSIPAMTNAKTVILIIHHLGADTKGPSADSTNKQVNLHFLSEPPAISDQPKPEIGRFQEKPENLNGFYWNLFCKF